MAYFLDPALAALCNAAPATVPAKVMPNKFAKACDAGCGGRVDAGKGRLEKKAGAWKVYHLAC
jgi:hypothetical protein